MFANVIIPAFFAPYLAMFLPWAIGLTLFAEFVVWKGFHWRVASSHVLGWVFLGNVVSTFAGMFISAYLFVPFGFENGSRGNPEPVPEYGWLIYAAMFQACFLSMVIEYVALVPFRRKWGISRLEISVVLGNVASYVGLTISLLLLFPNLFKTISEN